MTCPFGPEDDAQERMTYSKMSKKNFSIGKIQGSYENELDKLREYQMDLVSHFRLFYFCVIQFMPDPYKACILCTDVLTAKEKGEYEI